METHIEIAGILLILLALLHLFFPWYFRWKEDLKPLRLINRQMMRTHTFFISLTVCLMGVLCLNSTTELMETELGRTISVGMGIFWACRLIIQFFGYSSTLWKGKLFETGIHILFTGLWIYFTSIFLLNGLGLPSIPFLPSR